eukprot:384168-Lingulodinium_polyedra.AAC.1
MRRFAGGHGGHCEDGVALALVADPAAEYAPVCRNYHEGLQPMRARGWRPITIGRAEPKRVELRFRKEAVASANR